MQAKKPLRIVTFNYIPMFYEFLADYIFQTHNQHVLAITTPGSKLRATPSYIEVVKAANHNVNMLITKQLETVTPIISAIKPDLILCLSFPHRIKAEIFTMPTYGAINIHPTVLPAYRGCNVMRQFYDNAPQFGATAHWINSDYDTGNILSSQSASMPDIINKGSIFPVWINLIRQAIAEGVEKAVSGDLGIVQDDSKASYAAPFTEEEICLDWQATKREIERKFTALSSFLDPAYPTVGAKAKLNGQLVKVRKLAVLDWPAAGHTPGEVLENGVGYSVIAVADGAVQIQIAE
ncbi:methionyl-tRNA formyltransferase [Crenothrix polyspora]|uniref:Putative Methionyl-tRNA formyltransferase n=1 Tax=Crenothrix polyspora TaxID=360316 RepID=A0A1R4H4R1_9GAMM|nr:formyltransferase family protein [Crenothrix polyspora]SJM90810.1 putative Methionyl-tRNA formyltransferase [Crenothrix polyspora]